MFPVTRVFCCTRPGKSCKSSSSGKLRSLQCPQNSAIHEKGQRETCVLNVDGAWWNPQILIVIPQSIALQPKFWILNTPLSILLPHISFIQPQFSIVTFSSTILTQKYRIFDSKCPQNSGISDNISASAAWSFFQVCVARISSCRCCQCHVLLVAHVASYVCRQLHVLPIAHIVGCTCC